MIEFCRTRRGLFDLLYLPLTADLLKVLADRCKTGLAFAILGSPKANEKILHCYIARRSAVQRTMMFGNPGGFPKDSDGWCGGVMEYLPSKDVFADAPGGRRI